MYIYIHMYIITLQYYIGTESWADSTYVMRITVIFQTLSTYVILQWDFTYIAMICYDIISHLKIS